MNRLQKKCAITSAGLHLLLLAMLVFGPAFLSSSSRPDNIQEITFIPLITTDANVSGGGDPKGSLPPPNPKRDQEVKPPAPPQPQPDKQPVADKNPPPEPKTQKQEKQIEKQNPDSLEPAKNQKHKIDFEDAKIVVRTNNSRELARQRAEAEAKAAADRSRKLAAAFKNAASNLSENFSGSTEVKLLGPGGGGVPYGNWLSAVRKIYMDALVAPDNVRDDPTPVKAEVTVARDGSVLSYRITSFSNSQELNLAVTETLKRVTNLVPLPEGAKEDRRTVTINFTPALKQTLG